MTTYLAFLRAINLGARRKFPKDALREAVGAAGFTDVETYLHTGNVRLSTAMRSRSRIERTLELAFEADRGFAVPTIVFTTEEFAEIARDTRELHEVTPGIARHYVALLKDEPDRAVRATLEAAPGPDRLVLRGRAAHALLSEGFQGHSVDSLAPLKLLGVATTRNDRVVGALAERWCAAG